MTVQSPSIVLSATDATLHRNWIAAVSTALDALGVVQTTDTGQVDLTSSTVDLPAGTTGGYTSYWNTVPVFQIRKLVAAGNPDIFIRIEFGVFQNSQSGSYTPATLYPNLRFTTGSGTDGAGNLVRVEIGSQCVMETHSTNDGQFAGSSAANSTEPSATAQECDFASDGQNYLTIMLGENAPTFESHSICTYAIERTLDTSANTYDADGYMEINGSLSPQTWHHVDFTNAKEWDGAGLIASATPPFNITPDASTVMLFPLISAAAAVKASPTLAVAYYTVNLTLPSAFSVMLHGVNRTFKACPKSNTGADIYNTGTRLALRFD